MSQKYKEFDRKIRISRFPERWHHSARATNQIREDTMQPYRVVAVADRMSYIHVRDTDAGCYDFCIERTEDEESDDENQSSKGGYSHE